METVGMKFDYDITKQDIQGLCSADAVAGLFQKLGYSIDKRVEQTAGTMGIAADGTQRPIKRIELIADQDTLLQVYLFEVSSVTVTHTRALARSLRNRSGNYILVLTSDYERIDFVLLEKYVPPAKKQGPLTQQQVGVRPHTLTVERRKPTPVQLRVLRLIVNCFPAVVVVKPGHSLYKIESYASFGARTNGSEQDAG